MGESLSNKIFGLPSAHFAYVKKIKPGLPLFKKSSIIEIMEEISCVYPPALNTRDGCWMWHSVFVEVVTVVSSLIRGIVKFSHFLGYGLSL
ncbi:hypothetical protein MKW98_005828 [Papaver atlanticum]|uniref:Uncharacterized protein n=1 Tax=Papaver atlanticum TaxID=357466 RepID=A0AAD4TDN0_9MAGN|nr:hypothetical protein MKW98_005828 [Papaver atlanticum]